MNEVKEMSLTVAPYWLCVKTDMQAFLLEVTFPSPLPPGSDMAVFCLLCGKRFQTQTALQQHMEVHAGVRSYICSECNRTFPSHTALKRHLRSHTACWTRI
ncbi:hypothetical protein E2320_007228 [Naja naja]|nr:hypothetical protein E2320_007228 [Naja naja]